MTKENLKKSLKDILFKSNNVYIFYISKNVKNQVKLKIIEQLLFVLHFI